MKPFSFFFELNNHSTEKKKKTVQQRHRQQQFSQMVLSLINLFNENEICEYFKGKIEWMCWSECGVNKAEY